MTREVQMTKGIALLFVSLLSLLLFGCVTYSPSGVMAEKQESVAVAAKVVKDVKTLDLRVHPGEKCWVGDSEVRSDYVHGKQSAVGTASNACKGTQY